MSYLQTCLAESGSGPVRPYGMGFHKLVCSRAALEAAAISPGMQSLLLSSPPMFPDAGSSLHFWVHKPWQSFSQTDTPPPQLAPGSAPQPQAVLGSRCTCHRQDGMGQRRGAGAKERGWGNSFVIWGCHWWRYAWDATQPGRTPVHTSHPAAQCGVSG